jgi:hypothetical protein
MVAVTTLDAESLRWRSLARQFPAIRGRDSGAVAELVSRVGPVQSQVPRAPFAGIAARLPGVGYDAIAAAFDDFRVIKNSTLRVTVHSVVREQFAAVESVAVRTRRGSVAAHLKVGPAGVDELWAETERYAQDWRDRTDLVRHARTWLSERGHDFAAARLDSAQGANYVWGYPPILRRPADGRWERRTDTSHRAVRGLVPLPRLEPDAALVELVRIHLGAYGPATRRDIAWWSGENLTRVDAALATLGDELERYDEGYLDLATGKHDGGPGDDVRLLPEFDGLVCGYAPAGRGRFLDERHKAATAGTIFDIYHPYALAGGRIVATWRLLDADRKPRLSLTMLPGERRLAEDEVPAAAFGQAQRLVVDDVEVVS